MTFDLDHIDALLAEQREFHARGECDEACEFCPPAVCEFRELVHCKASEVQDVPPWRNVITPTTRPEVRQPKTRRAAPKRPSKRQARILKEMERDKRIHQRHCG